MRSWATVAIQFIACAVSQGLKYNIYYSIDLKWSSSEIQYVYNFTIQTKKIVKE